MKETKTTKLKENNGTARELYSVQIERIEAILESVIEFQTKPILKIVDSRKKEKAKINYNIGGSTPVWGNDCIKCVYSRQETKRKNDN